MGRLWSLTLLPAMLLTTLWSPTGVRSHLNLFISQEEVRKLLGKYSRSYLSKILYSHADTYYSKVFLRFSRLGFSVRLRLSAVSRVKCSILSSVSADTAFVIFRLMCNGWAKFESPIHSRQAGRQDNLTSWANIRFFNYANAPFMPEKCVWKCL
jgi:hypothetical protein